MGIGHMSEMKTNYVLLFYEEVSFVIPEVKVLALKFNWCKLE